MQEEEENRRLQEEKRQLQQQVQQQQSTSVPRVCALAVLCIGIFTLFNQSILLPVPWSTCSLVPANLLMCLVQHPCARSVNPLARASSQQLTHIAHCTSFLVQPEACGLGQNCQRRMSFMCARASWEVSGLTPPQRWPFTHLAWVPAQRFLLPAQSRDWLCHARHGRE